MSVVFSNIQIEKLAVEVQNGNLEAVMDMVNSGADITETGKNGMTLTHFALVPKSTEVLQYLLDQGADPIGLLKNGDTVPHDAASRGDGNADHLAVLLRAGVDPNLVGGEAHKPLLTYAALGKNIAAAQLLLSAGADPNWADKFMGTVFHLVVSKQNFEFATLLIKHGADPTITVNNKGPALEYYCKISSRRKFTDDALLKQQFEELEKLIYSKFRKSFGCNWQGKPRQ